MSEDAQGKVKIRRGSILSPQIDDVDSPADANGGSNMSVRFKEPEEIASSNSA
jgi:hypothetical protein